MRETNQVIDAITTVLTPLDIVGLAVEPIPTMADQKDELPGDYAIRVSRLVEAPKESESQYRYVQLYEASIIMMEWRFMPEERFHLQLSRLVLTVQEFLEKDPYTSDKDARVVTRNGVYDMGTASVRAKRGSLQ